MKHDIYLQCSKLNSLIHTNEITVTLDAFVRKKQHQVSHTVLLKAVLL